VAFVSPTTPVTPEELIAFCAGRMARFKVPREIVVTDELPKTPTGKIQKPVLRESYLAGQVPAGTTAAGRS
jgi:acyl-CoA synthetase (AMP-forming)/AMP-acid ligase II